MECSFNEHVLNGYKRPTFSRENHGKSLIIKNSKYHKPCSHKIEDLSPWIPNNIIVKKYFSKNK